MIQAFDQEQLEKTESVIKNDLIANGVNIALVVDLSGHIIANSCGKDAH